MFCRYCGGEVPDDASFCPYCGARLVKDAPDVPEAPEQAAGETAEGEQPEAEQPETGVLEDTPAEQEDGAVTPGAGDEAPEDGSESPEEEPAADDIAAEVPADESESTDEEDAPEGDGGEGPEDATTSPEEESAADDTAAVTSEPETSTAPGVQKPLPAVEKPARRGPSLSRRALFGGLGAAAGIGAAAALYLRLGSGSSLGGSEAEAATVAFGSRSGALVSTVTIITPYGQDGEPIPGYEVRIRAAVDASGADIDLSDVETALAVDDAGGFTLGDLGDLPEGTYEVTVTTAEGEVLSLPPLEVVGEGAEDAGDSGSSSAGAGEPLERLDVKPAELVEGADSEDAGNPVRLGKWGAFLKVVRDGIAEYGEPEVEVSSSLYGYEGELRDIYYLLGLGMARLVDFGDGNTRLVVGHLKSPDTDYPYVMEVWEYDEDSDGALQVLSLENSEQIGEPNGPDFVFTTNSQGDALYIARSVYTFSEEYDADLGDTVYSWTGNELTVYGVRDRGGFGETVSIRETASYDEDTREWSYRYYINDSEVDEDTYLSAFNGYGYGYVEDGNLTRYFFVEYMAYIYGYEEYFMDSDVFPQEIVEEAEGTIATLEGLAGDVLDAYLAQGGDTQGDAE